MRAILLVTLPLALGAPALAHHGWGSYDSTKVIKFSATIMDVKYENPHVELLLQYEGKGRTMTLAPVFRMQNRGLPRESLVKGKTVTVEGYPSKVNADEMRIERITVDGKVVELR